VIGFGRELRPIATRRRWSLVEYNAHIVEEGERRYQPAPLKTGIPSTLSPGRRRFRIGGRNLLPTHFQERSGRTSLLESAKMRPRTSQRVRGYARREHSGV
jgi:hypothetical protein